MSHKIAHGAAVSDQTHSAHMERCAALGWIIQAKNYTDKGDDDIGSHVWYKDEDGNVFHSSVDACNAPLPDVTGRNRE